MMMMKMIVFLILLIKKEMKKWSEMNLFEIREKWKKK
jgi:hypothetical protein